MEMPGWDEEAVIDEDYIIKAKEGVDFLAVYLSEPE